MKSRPATIGNIVSGLSVAGLLVPEAVAYAAIAGFPQQHALIAAMIGLVAYAVIGGSGYAIVSSTSSSAAILAAAVASLGATDPAHRYALGYGLVLLTGVFFLLAALARLGHLAAYISRPVLRGFAFGLAVVIVIRQLPHLVEIHTNAGSIWVVLHALATHVGAWNPVSLLIGAVALALLLVLKRIRLFPAAFAVIVLGIALSLAVDLSRYGVSLVGAIDFRQLRPGLPSLRQSEWLRLGELAFAMVVILYAESWGSIRSLALRHNEAINANRELSALGVANVLSALAQGLPVGAGFSGTSANEDAGASGKLSGVVAAIAVFILVVTAAPLLARLPVPILAAIVISALLHALDPRPLLGLFRLNRDQYLALAAIAGVIGFGVLPGMLIAVALSLVTAIRRFSQSEIHVLGELGDSRNYIDVSRNAAARLTPGVLILRPEEPLFFANAERITEEVQALLRRYPDTQVVVLSLEESGDLDSTAVEALHELTQSLTRGGCQLLLARVKYTVRDLLARGHADGDAPNTYWSVADAADAAATIVAGRER